MGDWSYVIAAYSLTTVILVLYALSLYRRSRQAGSEESES